MSEDYLQSTREKSLVDDSNVSESELHANNENIRDGWQRIQDLKHKIAEAKKQAIQKVNDEYAAEMADAVSDYALLISLSR
jgi:enoyl-[acyl-carrier-protein] reductase (NADH)